MKLHSPNPEDGFIIKENDKGWRLIGPSHAKHLWKPEERVYRSALIDSKDNILSMGFPKFGNYSEAGFEDVDLEFKNANEIYLTLKMDGMLVIRSIIDGQPYFRTRGNFDLGEYHDMVMAEVDKYPILLDKYFWNGAHLYFEFCSPANRIILPYDKAALTFLGYWDCPTIFSDYIESVPTKLMSFDRLIDLQKAFEDRLPLLVDYKKISLLDKEAISEISNAKDIEGYVARVGPYMTKIKASQYLRLHRLRFLMSEKSLRAICDDNNIQSKEGFQSYIQAQGGDWELFASCEDSLDKYFSCLIQVEERWRALNAEVEIQRIKWQWNRKDFALNYASKLEPYEKPSAFLLLDNRREEAYTKLRKSMMDLSFAGDNLLTIEES